MVELKRARAAACFVGLSAAVGVSACSSGSSGSSNTAANSGCTGDPRAETFSIDMTHIGDSKELSFVIASSNYTPPAVDDNTWTIKILDSSGQAVKDAVLSFPANDHPSDPWMPEHTHGDLPAKYTNNGDGTYAIAPLDFFMGGLWSTFISAKTPSTADSTTFTFCVNE
jgi:hypothetical protein